MNDKQLELARQELLTISSIVSSQTVNRPHTRS